MINKLILLVEKAYSPAFNLAIAIATSRIYGAEAVGNIALVFAFSALGQYLTSRGTDQNIYVAYASCPQEQIADAAEKEIRKRLIRLMTSMPVLASLYVLLLFSLPQPEVLFFGLLGILLGAISACATPNEIQLIVRQNFNLLVALKYSSGFFAIVIGYLVATIFYSGTMVLTAVLFLERTIYMVLTIRYSKLVSSKNADSSEVKSVPRVNVHILITAAAVFMYTRLDQVYIYGAFSSKDLGIYFATIKLFEITNLFILAAITSQLHIMADARRDSFFVVSIERHLLALSSFMIAIITLAAPIILGLVFAIYLESYSYIYALAAATFFGAIGAIKAPWVAKNNRFKANAYFTVFGSISALGVLTILKPESLLSVSITMALSQFIVNILCPLLVKEERRYLVSLITWKKT